jgi:hypothetical protein
LRHKWPPQKYFFEGFVLEGIGVNRQKDGVHQLCGLITTFFHPDFTVGTGIPPIQSKPKAWSRGL